MTDELDGPTARDFGMTEDVQAAEVAAWRECALYDATMEGPVFKGWDRSAMDRARRRFIERARLTGAN